MNRENRVPSAEVLQASGFRRRMVAYFTLIAFTLGVVVLLLIRSSMLPLQDWDESRTGMNALLMASVGHPLVTLYHGTPDHWMTKPPLFIWEVAVLLRSGLPLLVALRLPSILAAAATVAFLLLFCLKRLGSLKAGVWSALLLLTSTMYIGSHGASTGDYDATLTLWVVVYTLALWCYLQDRFETAPATGQRARRLPWLVFAGTALALAIWTKGVAGAIPLPGFRAMPRMCMPKPIRPSASVA